MQKREANKKGRKNYLDLNNFFILVPVNSKYNYMSKLNDLLLISRDREVSGLPNEELYH